MRAVSLAPFQHTSPLLLRTAVLYALMLFVSSFFVWHDGMGCTIRTDPSFQTALFRPKKHLANRLLAPFQHTSPFISRTAPDFSVRSAQGSGFHSREFMGCAIRSGPLAYHLGRQTVSSVDKRFISHTPGRALLVNGVRVYVREKEALCARLV